MSDSLATFGSPITPCLAFYYDENGYEELYERDGKLYLIRVTPIQGATMQIEKRHLTCLEAKRWLQERLHGKSGQLTLMKPEQVAQILE